MVWKWVMEIEVLLYRSHSISITLWSQRFFFNGLRWHSLLFLTGLSKNLTSNISFLDVPIPTQSRGFSTLLGITYLSQFYTFCFWLPWLSSLSIQMTISISEVVKRQVLTVQVVCLLGIRISIWVVVTVNWPRLTVEILWSNLLLFYM